MSQALAQADLTGATIGKKVTLLDWSALNLPATSQDWTNPPHITFNNESGCGLLITLPGSGRSFRASAGAWTTGQGIELTPNDKTMTALVEYIIPNAPVSLFLGTYWYAGEQVLETTLGNSPIGLSGGGVPLAVTTVQNDGNAPVVIFIEATQQGAFGNSNIAIGNDGSMASREWTGAVFNLLFRTIPNALAGNANVILSKAGNFFTHVLGNFQVDGSSSLDAGAITTNGSGTLTIGELSSDGALVRTNGAGILTVGGFVSNGNASIVGNIGEVGGIGTQNYGVLIHEKRTKDLNIVNTSVTTVLTLTAPADGNNHEYLISADLFVGAGNTNNGTVSLLCAYTDVYEGALNIPFNVYSQANPISNISQLKGKGIRTDIRSIRATSGSTISVTYQNTAAGTISDFSSASAILVN